MSLINQMLKDLENRSRPNRTPETSMSGLFSNEASQLLQEKNHYVSYIIVFISILTIFLILSHKNIFLKKSHAISPSVISRSVSEDAINIPAVSHADDTATSNIPISSTMLTGVTLQIQQNTTSLRLLLNQATLYSVAFDADQNKLHITLDHTTLISDLPAIDYMKSAVKDIQISNDAADNLRIDLTLNQDAQLNYLDMINPIGKSPELQLDISSKKPAETIVDQKTDTASTQNSFIKKPIEKFEIEQHYKNALYFSDLGQTEKASQMLSYLLGAYPDFHPARVTLVTLLLQNEHLNRARQVLHAGLDQVPDYPPFIELQAQMLMREGKFHRALDLMQRIPAPQIEIYPDYYAFMAALYQRLGQGSLAAKLYEQLLARNPNKAVWWMGLG